jgi:hypothetical protein
MTPVLVISLAGLAVTALGQLAGVLVWGAALNQRVRALERDVEPLKNLDVRVARIDARLEALLEQFKDLNASIRWMRQASRDQSVAPIVP